MANGYTGTLLRIDLTSEKIEKVPVETDFLRTYLGGGAIGTFFLHKETNARTDPLSPENVLCIAPGVTTGAAVSGVSRCSVTALSPLTGMVGDSQAGGAIGPMIKRAGYDALLITGRAASLKYIAIDGDQIQIRNADHLSGHKTNALLDSLDSELEGKGWSIIQCGPAGEKLVRFACLMVDRNDVAGRTGLGAVFGSKNLRAVAVRGQNDLNFADPEGLKDLAQKAAKKIPDAGFPATLQKHGTPGVVGFQAEGGNLATHNYSRGFTAEYMQLCGETYDATLGAGSTTCFGCAVRCRKKVKADKPYQLSDDLGGPEFETLGLLGSNLDITDPAAVARANQLCGEYGMDTISMGGLAGYVFECLEKGLITENEIDGVALGFSKPEGLFKLIEKTGQRQGIGDVLAEGFNAAVEKFGPATKDLAVHVKNQGLAVHMPQVKPSQALMYAVCPIGPDHQSCEHDWLLDAGGDDCLGLAIVGQGDRDSTNLAKVRMTINSQFYYSLLDSLCLCMFCWGPGNLFAYRELEDLVRFTTGWDCTFFELIKAGERRVNLMRQLNAKRGFSREHDSLPARVFTPLPDGPSKDKHVDSKSFAEMLDNYFNMIGWDPVTGNPSAGKLKELGLEWSI
jgi:aldehyde:ferredoxin oxidoreductase